MLSEKIDAINDLIEARAQQDPALVLHIRNIFEGEDDEGEIWRRQIGCHANVLKDCVTEILGPGGMSVRAGVSPQCIVATVTLRDFKTGEEISTDHIGDNNLTDPKSILTDATCKALSELGIGRKFYLGFVETDDDLTGVTFYDWDSATRPGSTPDIKWEKDSRTYGRRPGSAPPAQQNGQAPPKPSSRQTLIGEIYQSFDNDAEQIAHELADDPDYRTIRKSVKWLCMADQVLETCRAKSFDITCPKDETLHPKALMLCGKGSNYTLTPNFDGLTDEQVQEVHNVLCG